ncbi:MAG: hypothetical protein HY319_14775 [Armatimonadetes bacterium]|nr:hypothetical protein [Armatimonadota bacterium]
MKGVTAHLDLHNVHGTSVYGVRGTEWNLVKRNQENGSFEPVDRMDRAVPPEELDANFGVWVDKEVTEGHLWWKKVVRPEDGKVQADEVVDFQKFREGEMSHIWHRLVGGDELYTFDGAKIFMEQHESGTHPRMETEWTLHRGDWSRYWEYVSPLAPPNA